MAQDTYPPVAGVARCELLWTANDGVRDVSGENTVYFFRIGGWDSTSLTTLMEEASAAWNTNVAPTVSVEATLNLIRTKNLTDPDNPTFERVVDHDGSLAGESTSYTVCAVTRFIGGDDPPPAKSYIRHGPLGESQVRGNDLTTAAVAAIATAWDGFRSDVEGATDATQVIVSVFEPDGVEPDIFRDAGEVNEVVSSNVRRLVGRSSSRLT